MKKAGEKEKERVEGREEGKGEEERMRGKEEKQAHVGLAYLYLIIGKWPRSDGRDLV